VSYSAAGVGAACSGRRPFVMVREFAAESGLRVAIEFADAPPRIYPDDDES